MLLMMFNISKYSILQLLKKKNNNCKDVVNFAPPVSSPGEAAAPRYRGVNVNNVLTNRKPGVAGQEVETSGDAERFSKAEASIAVIIVCLLGFDFLTPPPKKRQQQQPCAVSCPVDNLEQLRTPGCPTCTWTHHSYCQRKQTSAIEKDDNWWSHFKKTSAVVSARSIYQEPDSHWPLITESLGAKRPNIYCIYIYIYIYKYVYI